MIYLSLIVILIGIALTSRILLKVQQEFIKQAELAQK